MTRNIILFDDDGWRGLLPLTFTRPIAELRVGILTIKEKWEKHLTGQASYITQDYLSQKYTIHISDDNLIVNSRLLPNAKIVELINKLAINEALLLDDTLVAARMNKFQFDKLINNEDLDELNGTDLKNHLDTLEFISRPFHIFIHNAKEIERDFHLLTAKKYSQPIPNTVQTINEENIFIEEGAKLNFTTLNASAGPIYIGRNSEIMEGAMIRGPFALCEGSVVKMGAKIYSKTTIGPYSKVGGEISNCVFLGYSNKGHDGYLGNSVIGEWCNLGADTNCSNLKNNYAEIKIWDYNVAGFKKTGLQFCGMIMGDHSKAGINSMFNTGTVIGIASNIFGDGFPRNFIPSFSWGGTKGYKTHLIDKMFETAEIVMARRNKELLESDKIILKHIFLNTATYRNWES